MGLAITKVRDGDWGTVRRNFDKIKTNLLGPGASPTFAELILSGLTASRLIATNTSKAIVSVSDLTAWINGTSNQITVTDNGDGTITLSTPQDIHVDATPEFAGFVIKAADDEVVAFMDDSEFYITLHAPVEIVTGNPIGLLLALTYQL